MNEILRYVGYALLFIGPSSAFMVVVATIAYSPTKQPSHSVAWRVAFMVTAVADMIVIGSILITR